MNAGAAENRDEDGRMTAGEARSGEDPTDEHRVDSVASARGAAQHDPSRGGRPLDGQAADLLGGAGGVYHVVAPVSEIAEALSGAGWSAHTVTRARDKAGLLAEIAEQLDLSEWFGQNWDALWDALTDLTEPTALILATWAELAREDARDWSVAMEIFSERSQQEPPFAVVLA